MKIAVNITSAALAPKVPYLVQHTVMKIIVLVRSINTNTKTASGTVLHAGDSQDYKVGGYSEDWSIIADPSSWEILPDRSTITFTQDL